jgi:translation initiation factor 5B
MQLIEKNNIAPGMPFLAYKNNLEEIKEIFKKEISENIKTDKKGIIAKADSLGSLEALLVLLKQSNIPVLKAGIGEINKADIVCAKANFEIDELDAIIAGFNVEIEEDAKEIKGNVKIITNEVIYELIDKLVEFRKEKINEIEKRRLMSLAHLCKLDILHQYVFRNTNPCIFGVKIEAGRLFSGTNLIDETGIEIGKIKNIQSEKKSVQEATEGMEVAISISGVNFERQLEDKKFLYSDMGESSFRSFKKNKDLLSSNELKALQELAEIKRKKKPEWGI